MFISVADFPPRTHDAFVSFLVLRRRCRQQSLSRLFQLLFSGWSLVAWLSHSLCSLARHLTFNERVHPYTHTKWNLLIKQHGGIYQRYISPAAVSSFIHLVFALCVCVWRNRSRSHCCAIISWCSHVDLHPLTHILIHTAIPLHFSTCPKTVVYIKHANKTKQHSLAARYLSDVRHSEWLWQSYM